MSEPKVGRVVSKTTIIKVTFHVADAPPIRLPWSASEIDPDTVRVTWIFGSGSTALPDIQVSGCRLKKDGSHGRVRSTITLYTDKDIPEWLATAIKKIEKEGL